MVKEKLYLRPGTIDEALRMAGGHKDSRFIGGGTDVIVNKFQGNDDASCVIDISGIEELKQIIRNGKHLKIGSSISLDELRKDETVLREFSVLNETIKAIASPLIRKTATVAGNLLCENRCVFYNQSTWWRQAVGNCLKCEGDTCIATGGDKNCFSKFVSDLAIALISIDACVEVVEPSGSYIMRLEDIYTGDGVNPRKVERGALIKSIHVPLNGGYRSVFKKLRQRESIEFSSLTSVVTVNTFGKIKIVLGGVDPKPIIIEGTIKDDKQDLIRQAMKKPRIVDNDVFSRKYRKEMIAVFLNRSFDELSI